MPPAAPLRKAVRHLPRNAHEWSTAFREADICESVKGHGDAHELDLKEGLYVAVSPSGNRRDDCTVATVEYIARIVRVADSDYGPLVKLHWYYKKGELSAADSSDQATKGLIDSMGHKELLSLSCDTFDHADMVSRIVPVYAMSLVRPSFPVIDENTLFTRKGCTLLRSWDISPTMVNVLPGAWQNICTRGCERSRRYNPRTDVLRHCEFCIKWYHIGCLAQADSNHGPTLADPDENRPEQPAYPLGSDDYTTMHPHSFTQADFKLWQVLLRKPIQRGFPDTEYPLSFESLMTEIRWEECHNGCPKDVHEFIEECLDIAPHLIDSTPFFKGLFLGLPQHPLYYVCPGCESSI